MSYVCERCAVWRPRESVTFTSLEAAEDHAMRLHPDRLLKAYRSVADSSGWRESEIANMLRDHNANPRSEA